MSAECKASAATELIAPRKAISSSSYGSPLRFGPRTRTPASSPSPPTPHAASPPSAIMASAAGSDAPDGPRACDCRTDDVSRSRATSGLAASST